MSAYRPGRCSMIGLEPSEMEWVRLLIKLLRHRDPLAPELARQALEYVETIAEAAVESREPRSEARS